MDFIHSTPIITFILPEFMKSICLTILLLILLSCEEKSKTDTFSLTHDIVLTDDNIIGKPLDLVIKDSLIIILDKTDNPFLIYDITNNEHIKSFGNYGNGPLEFNSLYQITSINDQLLTYDTNLNTLYSIDFGTPSHLNYKVNKIWRKDTLVNFFVLPAKNKQYISYGSYPDYMIKLLNNRGEIQESYFEYPYKDENERNIKPHLRSLAYRSNVINNPDGTKFVQAMNFCDMIIATFWNGQVLTKKEMCKTYPEYRIEEDKFGYSVPISAHSSKCYLDVAATNKYIYVLYSGKNFAEDKYDSLYGNIIFVYNWDLNCIAKIYLDLPTYQICPTKDDCSLYTISLVPDYKIVKYTIPIF